MKIAIVGTGNVASQLVKRFQELQFPLFGVLGSTKEKTNCFSEKHAITALDNPASVSGTDLTILCVQDSKLGELIPLFSEYSNVVTTSGTFDITPYSESENAVGVFYPLQSFSSGVSINFSSIPVFIESADNEFLATLMKLANDIGESGIEMAGSERVHLHLGAVFINNFTHHINSLAKEYGNDHHIDFSWYSALIDETFRKIKLGARDEDQTGPARRNDRESIQKHLELLDPKMKIVYQALTESIQQKFKKHD